VKTQRILQWYNKLISYANLFFKIFALHLQRTKTNIMTLYEQIIDKKPLLDYVKQFPATGKSLVTELKRKKCVIDLKLGTVWDLETIYKLDTTKHFVFTQKLIFKEQ